MNLKIQNKVISLPVLKNIAPKRITGERSYIRVYCWGSFLVTEVKDWK
jgi:hypothetical protein